TQRRTNASTIPTAAMEARTKARASSASTRNTGFVRSSCALTDELVDDPLFEHRENATRDRFRIAFDVAHFGERRGETRYCRALFAFDRAMTNDESTTPYEDSCIEDLRRRYERERKRWPIFRSERAKIIAREGNCIRCVERFDACPLESREIRKRRGEHFRK